MIVDLVCFAKNEDVYIEEWIDYHIKLGFDNIILYQNDWVCNVERPNLEKRTISGKGVQIDSYQDYLSTTSSDWVAFIDADEFIVLHKHDSIKEFLSEYYSESGIAMTSIYFGSQGKLVRDSQNPNSLLKQFTLRDSQSDQHIKTLLNIKVNLCYMELPHNPNTKLMDTNGKVVRGPLNPKGPIDVIQLNHYYHKTFEDWKLRCNRGQGSSIFSQPKKESEWHLSKTKYMEVEDTKARDFFYN